MKSFFKVYWRQSLAIASLAWIIFALSEGAANQLDELFTFSIVMGPLLISVITFVAVGAKLDFLKENWRPVMVLATVVWGVIGYSSVLDEIGTNEGYPLIFGPFVIALAIYFLFPKRKNE